DGQAIFHTAADNGPSTMDRSYRPMGAVGDSGATGGVVSTVTGAVTPLIRISSIVRETAHSLYEARYFILGGIHRASCTDQSNVRKAQSFNDGEGVEVAVRAENAELG